MRKHLTGIYLLALTVSLGLGLGPTCYGQKKLTFHDAISWKLIRGGDISVDGRYVAYVLRQTNWKSSRFESHIWVVDTQSAQARQFTQGPSSEGSPRFSPDGKMLAFLTSRKSNDSGNQRSRRQIWLISVQGGEARQLTSVREGVREFKWAPDGDSLFFTTRESLPRGIQQRRDQLKKEKFDEEVVDRDQFRIQIWKIALDSGKAERVFRGVPGLRSIALSPDGGSIAYTTNYTGRPDDGKKFDIWILDLASGQTRQLTRREGGERQPTWSPDGKSVLFFAGKDPQTSYSQTNLFMVPTQGGTPVNLNAGLDRSIDSADFVTDDALLVTVEDGFYTPLYRLDLKTRAFSPVLQDRTNIGGVRVARRAGRIAFIRSSSSEISVLYTAAADGSSQQKLVDPNPGLKEFELARQEVISWKSPDGKTIQGLLVTPLDYRAGEKVPLIVYPHGGPHGRSRDTLPGGVSPQVLAARGYAVVMPNFRGSTGYGAAFDVANRNDLGGGDYRDIQSGIDALIQRGIADPTRLGIMGGSYGGYMTDWTISQTNRFAAAVSMYGIFNLITDFSNSNISSWEPNYLTDFYWDNPDIYLKHSAAFYAGNIKTPVLILHGQADTNTFISNSREMYTALRFLKRTVQLVTYPREGHGIGGEPNHVLDKSRRTLEWFDRYVMKKPESLPMGEAVEAGGWSLSVASAAASQESGDQSPRRVTVQVQLSRQDGKAADFPIDLARHVSLVLQSGRELPAQGLRTSRAPGDAWLKAGSVTFSGASEYSAVLIFHVPRDVRDAELRFGDFPRIKLNF